jgi:D-glycero-alpha-D-manno-heptose 1-phosphate guanylyltransferase
MDAIVICGGKGTRVGSITGNKIPKIMIEIEGKPFLEHLLNMIYGWGGRNVVLATGFKREVIDQYLERRNFYSWINPWINVSTIGETEPLDTGGAVLNALSTYRIHTDPFLVINGDCIVFPDLRYHDNIWDLYYDETDKPDCAMFSCKMEHDGRYGSLDFAPYNPFNGGMEFITGFRNGEPGKSWINCGWYIMRRSLFKDKEVQRMSLEKELFPSMMEQKNWINAMIIDPDEFIEIGTPEALYRAADILKNWRGGKRGT